MALLTIQNTLIFDLNIYQVVNQKMVLYNTLGGRQKVVIHVKKGDEYLANLSIDPGISLSTINCDGSDQVVTIASKDLKSNPDSSQKALEVQMTGNYKVDVYLLDKSGNETKVSKDGDTGQGSIHNALPGSIYRVASPNAAANMNFYWIYVTDKLTRDERGYEAIFEYTYASGTVSSTGDHSFTDGKYTYSKRLKATGTPQTVQLNPGEILVYDSATFAAPNSNFLLLSDQSPDITAFSTAAATGKSFVPGPNTTVIPYPSANYGGSAGAETADPTSNASVASFKTQRTVSTQTANLKVYNAFSQDDNDCGSDSGQPNTCAAYFRTTLVINDHSVTLVKIRFETAMGTATFNGATLSPSNGVYTVEPNMMRRIVVLQAPDSTNVGVSPILVQTSAMRSDQWVHIHTDTGMHQKIAGMSDGFLDSNRSALGIAASDTVPTDSLNAVQKAAMNCSAAVTPSNSQNSLAVQSERAYIPENMSDQHFSLDFADNAYSYSSLSKEEAQAKMQGLLANAEPLGHVELLEYANLGSIWGDLKHFVVSVAHDIENGMKKMISAVVTTVEKTFSLVLNTVEQVASALKSLLSIVMADLKKLWNLIKALLDFKDYVKMYNYLSAQFTSGLTAGMTAVKNWAKTEDAKVDTAIDNLRTEISGYLGKSPTNTINPSGGATDPSGNPIMEALEWISGKIFGALFSYKTSGSINALANFVSTVQTNVIDTFISIDESTLELLKGFFNKPGAISDEMKQFVENVLDNVLKAIKNVVDAFFALVEEIADEIETKLTENIQLGGVLGILEKLFHIKDLSILKVMSFIYAIPVTVMYKLADKTLPCDNSELEAGTFDKYLIGSLDIVSSAAGAVTVPNTTLGVLDGSSFIPGALGTCISGGKLLVSVLDLTQKEGDPDALTYISLMRSVVSMVMKLFDVPSSAKKVIRMVNVIADAILAGVKIGFTISDMAKGGGVCKDSLTVVKKIVDISQLAGFAGGKENEVVDGIALIQGGALAATALDEVACLFTD